MSPGRTLAEIAAAVGAELLGDGALVVRRPVPPELAHEDGDLAIALRAEALAALASSPARMAVVPDHASPPEHLRGCLRVKRAPLAMARLLALFAPPPSVALGVHPTAHVDPTARLGKDVAVGPFVAIGPHVRVGAGTVIGPHASIEADAVVGERCRLHAGVRIGERVVLGDRVLVHANACLGSDGFSHATVEAGSIETTRASGRVTGVNAAIERIPSLGTVIVEDDVEIGAGTTIDRATLEATRIGAGTKIDNLVMVAHNTTIGRNCLIAAQAAISGSCRIGDRVVLGGRVALADHLTIGDDAIVVSGSGVARHVPAREVMMGLPAVKRAEFHRQLLALRRLQRTQGHVAELRERVAALEAAAKRP